MKKILNIKILIVCHKPYKIFRNDVFVPINAGREVACNDWLLQNTIGDNTGDNISKFNKIFCELTATYWAWKNYDKLGNPDYMGLMHYRTYFDFFYYCKKNKLKIKEKDFYNKDFLSKIFSRYDGIISERLFGKLSKNFSVDKHIPKFIENMCNIDGRLAKIVDCFSGDGAAGYYIHYKNMFILKKEDFFEYCEILFKILFEEKEKNKNLPPRSLGYVAETISSLIFIYFYKCKNRKLLELPWLQIFDLKNDFSFKNILKIMFIKTKKFLYGFNI